MAIDDSGEWWIGSEAADIEHYLFMYTRSGDGYPTTAYRAVICLCNSDRFRLKRAGSVTRRACAVCGTTGFICRKSGDWEEVEAEENAELYQCVDCGSLEANIGVGFTEYERPELDAVKWFFVGVGCADCGVLGCFNDGKVGWGPRIQVYESI